MMWRAFETRGLRKYDRLGFGRERSTQNNRATYNCADSNIMFQLYAQPLLERSLCIDAAIVAQDERH